jgi:hypothetical protein
MDEQLQHQRDVTVARLETLIQRGREIKDTRAVDAARLWQRDCASAVSDLSGGSKAHWLSRAFSSALLVRSASGGVVVEADLADIIERILGVLAQGVASLSRVNDVAAPPAPVPRLHQFEFVHKADLRPVLEQAFADSRAALERGEFALALILSCSVLESVLTDALEHESSQTHGAAPVDAGSSFETRIAAAESSGLIKGGCARLPPVARKYHDLTDADGELRSGAAVSERDARVAGQVLRVVLRDLDPGR